MALGHTARIELLIDAFLGLGQGGGGRCLLFLGRVGGYLLLLGPGRRKAHGLAFARQQAIDLVRALIREMQHACRGSLRQAQQPVARGQVQQCLAAFFELAGDGG